VRVLTESSVSGKIDKLKELKENVIIWRLIPAGKQYRVIHGLNEEDQKDAYFDPNEDWVDVSEKHMLELQKEMATESDF